MILRGKIIYSASVKNMFEHCILIWGSAKKSTVVKFDNIQKICITWISNAEVFI